VRLYLTVPRGELVVNRQADEDLLVAIRYAFDAMQRQLEDYIREHRGDMKVHEPLTSGRVAKLFADEGYGFIETAMGGKSIFMAIVCWSLGSAKSNSAPKCASWRSIAPKDHRQGQ
jgi:hypothetical protein